MLLAVIGSPLDIPDFLAAPITATSGNVTPAGEIIGRMRNADERREELARDWAAGGGSRRARR